ncbi:MAG: type 4a pilus biogenesis protein PilO [Planctomycetes bacterium]|nr:type 4a pilus biogenesis protein PilO [Planctomycetota bacterium]
MKPKFKKQSWIVTMSLCGAAVAYVLFMFLPEQRSIGDVRDEVDTKRQFVSGAHRTYETIEVAQRELAATKEYCRQFARRLPGGPEQSALFAKINLAAKQAGAMTTRFEPQTSIDYETLRQTRLLMSVRGTYGHIFDFLRRLETLDEVIWINELQFEAPKQTGQLLTCEVSLAVFAANPKKSD